MADTATPAQAQDTAAAGAIEADAPAGGFDLQAFLGARQEFRMEEIPMPFDALMAYSSDGKAPVFKVRNLTASEAIRAAQAAENVPEVSEAMKKMAGGDALGFLDLINEKIGAGKGEAPDYIRRLWYIRFGVVDPDMPGKTAQEKQNARHKLGLKLANICPPAFFLLSEKIGKLSQLGCLPGK